MLIIKIEAFENGAHDNDNRDGNVILDGWAVIPPNVGTMETLENFPFGNFEVEEVNGVPTMKKDSWVPLPMPEPEPIPEPEPEDDVWAELDRAYTEGVNTAYDQ